MRKLDIILHCGETLMVVRCEQDACKLAEWWERYPYPEMDFESARDYHLVTLSVEPVWWGGLGGASLRWVIDDLDWAY